MDAIEASAVRIRTLADGTLRAELDFEPRFAAAAFQLLGSPGQAVAVAGLKPPAPWTQDATPAKGGALAKLAGQWCAMPAFQAWAGVDGAEAAADYIRAACHVASRAHLDHDAEAAQRFHALIREPFAAHLKTLEQHA